METGSSGDTRNADQDLIQDFGKVEIVEKVKN